VTTSASTARHGAPAHATPPPAAPDLDAALAAVERAIGALAHTLTGQDIGAVEAASTALHDAMRAAMTPFAQVARGGALPAALRARFALANGQIAAQREALIRATARVEQNLEILIPRPLAETSVYSAAGASQRGPGRVIAAS
jgi:hypothetical protein